MLTPKYLREKAAQVRRLATYCLPVDDPGHKELMAMAVEFEERALAMETAGKRPSHKMAADRVEVAHAIVMAGAMFVIRLDRRNGKRELVMWLKSFAPVKWGPREHAMKFRSKGDARRAIEAIKPNGAWFIEPA
jgi:hypothetical protein